ncbi:Uncharacterized serine-rich protein C1E8.05 [Taphrina deformans PYCC 5710]|uniref:Uncharacterized serine-rich protein C1E8.05 n=1 Tax=Taphrina deformans (strain PYCC 5710 / ATCC 11124 / CBS 356.35 / IMI 108563 / JCM 9778 / NBRC 8474) TaxID=1097556 RepID=R4XER7_TAPDE|nr:Uncharacterized serine-rich protein C1E8.05 [Taphrina deformans PYCC 5710]|eukprot:CCG81862.1 Uncharacterized serine-rich protein C1E8.05 [Taphrina deformans PYCC 5710]
MQFANSLFFVACVAAQQVVNQILNPGANSVIQAGGGVQSITWTNPSSGNVSLALYSGSNPIVTVAPLTDSIANTGTFLWTPETWLPSGNDYSIGVTDLSGSAATQYSPFFTVQLCSTCSSSTRSTTAPFTAATVSVSGLAIGTRTNAAFPAENAVAATASGSQVSTGVANTASAVTSAPPSSVSSMPASSGASGVPTSVPALRGASVASQASAVGASANAILSQTGSIAAAAASATTTTKSGADSLQAGLLGFVGIAMAML